MISRPRQVQRLRRVGHLRYGLTTPGIRHTVQRQEPQLSRCANRRLHRGIP